MTRGTRMRIAHVIDYLADSDGHAAVCLRLAEEQARRGHVCAIATCRAPPDAGRRMPPGVPLQVLPRGRAAAVGFLREFHPDVLHLHGFWDLTILRAAQAARRARIPVVLSPHGVLAPWALRHRRFSKHLVWHAYARGCLRGIDALLATSGQEAADIRRGGFRQPVTTVPLGVDLPDLTPRAVPEQLADGTADARRIVLFLSRLHATKGLPLLVHAWAAVRPPGWRLVIAGPGNPREIDALQSLCAALGVTADVQLAGEVRGAGRDRLYRTAGLFVLPSHTENFGLVVAEALAHGLPVITTRGTPWSELVARQCGWWVEADVAALTRALREATQIPEETRQAMGARGRDLVRERYAWPACTDKLLALYEQVRHKSA